MPVEMDCIFGIGGIANGKIDSSYTDYRYTENLIDVISKQITIDNTSSLQIEVYVYNDDETFHSRRSNIPANSKGFKLTTTFLGGKHYVRLSMHKRAVDGLRICCTADLKLDNIKNNIQDIQDGYYLYPVIKNSYVLMNGEIAPADGWDRTDYVLLGDSAALRVILSETAKSSPYNCFYDSNKQFVSYFVINPGTNEIDVPANAKYAILSNLRASFETYKVQLVEMPEIVNITGAYYSVGGLQTKAYPDIMAVYYRFDSITYKLNGDLYTKTWEDLKADVSGTPSNDWFKVEDTKYLHASNRRLIINTKGHFKTDITIANDSRTIIGADFSVYPTYAFGKLPEIADRKIFNINQELYNKLPISLLNDLNIAEDSLYSLFNDDTFLMGYYSDEHQYGMEIGAELPITSMALKRFDDHMDFDSILCCGDSVLSYNQSTSIYVDDGTAYTALRNVNFMIDRNKLLYVEGNHDRNIVDPIMPKLDFVNLMYRPLKRLADVHFGGSSSYYYRDYPKHKIRIICLDLYDVLPDENYNYHSGYKQDQMNWLVNIALNVGSDWHVIVATHAAPYGVNDGMTDNGTPPYNSNVLIGILESFKNGTSVTISSTATESHFNSYSIQTNFSSPGNLIGCFVGHNHVDVLLEKNGIHYVSIECGYLEDNDRNKRTAFTYTTVAFDVVMINTSTRKVDFHRIGYGEDRSYLY